MIVGTSLKSYEFRRERERVWRELEGLVTEAERSDIRSLTPGQLLRLPSLYRATMSSLSVARAISLDRNVVLYLESLAARAYFIIYGARGHLSGGVAAFLGGGFPRAVRAAKWHILTAALVMVLGIATGFAMTLGNEDWYYTFVSGGMAEGRAPTTPTEDLRAILYKTADLSESLTAFAAYLFTHNAAIGMLAFALGFALGVPVVILMFYNGLMIGAIAALYHSRGLSVELWAWLSIHGTTELLAVALCGGAGLVLGGSVAFPGRHSRLETLARRGRLAARIVMGALLMFLLAGLLEGFGRQLILDVTTRYLIAAVAAVWWLLYLTRAGRTGSDDGRG